MPAKSVGQIISISVSVLLYGTGARAESPKLTFEVAAVRLSGANTRNMLRGGPGTSDPGQISWTACSLDFLIERAYGIQQDQFSGPGWLSSARYDISAKVPAGATAEQFDEMLQNLLVERFHLQVHHDTRVLSAYDLVLRRSPPKLKPSEWVPPPRRELEAGHQSFGDVPLFRTRIDDYYVVTGRGAEISDLISRRRLRLLCDGWFGEELRRAR